MPNLQSSPQVAPDYAHYRQIKDAADSLPETNKKHGINMGHYRSAHIQVVPSANCNPSVVVLWWSDGAGKFVVEHTTLAKAGIGDLVPYEFTVEARGRIMFVAVTGGIAATETVDIYVAGYDMDHSL